MKRTVSIITKEFKEIYRNNLYLILAFVVPLLMFVVFGYGISLDIENMPFGYVDMDRTPLSRDLIDRFIGRYFRAEFSLTDLKEAEEKLMTGRLRAVLYIPPDFSKDIYRGEGSVQLLIDGGYPFTSMTLKGYAEAIVNAFNQELLIKTGRPLRKAPLQVRVRFLFNESMRSRNALIPGLLVVVLMVNPAVLTATAIAREREFGTIYNIYTAPVKKAEFIVGKALPYFLISIINLFVLTSLVKVLFGVPMKGNLADMLPHAVLFIFTNILIGILISLVLKTVVSAQIVTLIITIIPAFLYSGLLIPVSHLGAEGRIMAHLYPSMYFMKVVHGVYLKRLGFTDMIREFGVLLLYCLVFFVISLGFFRKREG